MTMKTKFTQSIAAIGLMAMGTGVQADDLTLCWATWNPANALIEFKGLQAGDIVQIQPRRPFYFGSDGTRLV